MSTSGNVSHAQAATTDERHARNPKWFRQVLGHYPTGVCVVTAMQADGKPVGMAVGSFTSVSLDPPLVAFLPDRSSSSWPKIQDTGRFCVNVLGADHEPICRQFASKAADKFEGLSYRLSASGSPIIDAAIAWIDCDIHAVHEAGDHYIVLGLVNGLEHRPSEGPLLFFQGKYGRFSCP
jgi:3-hydroxy-9,10-secoandrosta-1,3,5(10)-triene-9,17-dione monooxygenase reductase component